MSNAGLLQLTDVSFMNLPGKITQGSTDGRDVWEVYLFHKITNINKALEGFVLLELL